ncbi:MAG: hypothetical protein NXI31_05400 [bacterium]|nr:hypothetical protein [bacterium]
MKFIGGVLVLLGGAMCASAADLLPRNNDPFDLAAGGVAIAVMGVVLMGWRQGFVLDNVVGIVTRYTGSLGIRFARTEPVLQSAEIVLELREVSTRSLAVTAWFVTLHNPGSEPFELTRIMEREEADEVARRASDILSLPLSVVGAESG